MLSPAPLLNAPHARVLARQLEEVLLAQAKDAGSLLMRGKHTAKTIQVGGILSAPGGGAIVLASAAPHSASALHSPLAPLGMTPVRGVTNRLHVCMGMYYVCMVSRTDRASRKPGRLVESKGAGACASQPCLTTLPHNHVRAFTLALVGGAPCVCVSSGNQESTGLCTCVPT